MRTVPAGIASALANEIQTRANSANPSASIWVNRPTTALTDDTFLERQTVAGVPASDASVAVCHPRFGGSNTEIYLGYISSGTARVVKSRTYTRMSSHYWVPTNFEDAAAISISVAFDGTMPKNPTNTYEFLTETSPWVFWINDLGALFARKLDSEEIIVLAESNCTKVSAVRAMWSEIPGFDFGLVVFFLMNSTLYYRQLIDGAWCDAEVVPSSYLPESTITSIRASRTWDYRITLMLKAGSKLYYVATQFGGFGSKNGEHLAIDGLEANGSMNRILYSNASAGNEHIDITSLSASAPYGGLYSVLSPSIANAYNVATTIIVEGEEVEDYGRSMIVIFDDYLVASTVSSQASAFSIVDELNTPFIAGIAELGPDGKTVHLMLSDFNNAVGICKVKYTPGTVAGMGGTTLTACEFEFTPTNLVPVFRPVPEVVEVTNI